MLFMDFYTGLMVTYRKKCLQNQIGHYHPQAEDQQLDIESFLEET